MRISFFLALWGFGFLAACGRGEPDTKPSIEASKITSSEPAAEAVKPPAAPETTRFIPGAIYGLSDAACTAIGGIEGRTEYKGKMLPPYCRMEGFPEAYQCGDDLFITRGGGPGKFRMHISGTDTFYPITMSHTDGIARWGGDHGTLSISDDQSDISFTAEGVTTACKRYVL